MFCAYILFLCTSNVLAGDITNSVFGSVTDGLPAAFGDFNSDELTDVFVLRNDKKTVEIFLASDEEPLLRPGDNLRCTFEHHKITSVVPGDFDGDACMDVLVTATTKSHDKLDVYIFWGGFNQLNCTDESSPVIRTIGQPLAIDYNQDMIIDLFGVDENEMRSFWVFNSTRAEPIKRNMTSSKHFPKPRIPHSHAFLDLNSDFTSDLFITTEEHFEVWYGNEEKEEFNYHHKIHLPPSSRIVGQSLFVDIEVIGRMELITPICYDSYCKNSSLMVYQNDKWQDLKIDFKDPDSNIWGFVPPNDKQYTDAITLRSGDFNMDGYPDLLATLQTYSKNEPQSFFLENVACENTCANFSRTYKVQWSAIKPFGNNTVMAVFYDFYQDGILDLILVQQQSSSSAQEYKTVAFKNSLDYDANFIKVMVLTGLTNSRYPMVIGNLGKKKRTYGTNLPGPRISYRTTTQEGYSKKAVSAQLPQSGHFSLNLPYTIFGLGRTPNFVDTLTVGLSNHSRDWTQIIPNSQMVVIPWPPGEPSRWRAQLFVTPSKLILMSVAALTGVCVLITFIIIGLYLKEKKEDRKERLQESNRFHFDAM